MRAALLDGDTFGASLGCLAKSAPEAVAAFPTEGDRITARDLDAASIRAAHGFLSEGIREGDLVGVLVPTAARLFVTLFGLWRAGAATSILPVQVGFGDDTAAAKRIARIITTAGIRHIVLDDSYTALGAELRKLLPRLEIVDPAASAAGGARELPQVRPDALSVVQFTSGSTSAAKGVVLPHRTAVAGLRACVVSGAFSPDDVFVQWVPTYHDMGFIGLLSHWLNGADVHVFSPTAFLRRPARLLEYFAEHRGTVITGPNFSYDYILDAIDPERLATLDLSSWRLAFNGAEPVSAASVRRFAESLRPCGVTESVMYPVYGMAEATLSISYPVPGDVPRIVAVDRAELAATGAVRVVPEDHRSAKAAVSVGKPVHGIDLRIVGEDGTVLGQGQLGEFQITGPPVTTGYYRAPEATAEAFDGSWFRTGDLGFRLGEDLFVAGRIKEMVIVRGQNFFPDDVEAVVRELPGVYRRRCIAFSDVDDTGAERIGVIVEADGETTESELRAEVARRVSGELDLAQIRVHVVKPRWLPRTTSGKWQRTLAARMLSAEPGA